MQAPPIRHSSKLDSRVESSNPHTELSWLLLDVTESSRPFLEALGRWSQAGQLDKRLSLPFGGSKLKKRQSTVSFAFTTAEPVSLLKQSQVTTTPAVKLDPASLGELVADVLYLGTGDKGTIETVLEKKRCKTVLVDPTITRSLSAQQARGLFELAAKQGVALALPTRWKGTASKLIQDCAAGKVQSNQEDTMVVLESLDESRQPGINHLPPIEDTSMDSITQDDPTLSLTKLLEQKDAQIAALEQQLQSGPSLPSTPKRSPSPALPPVNGNYRAPTVSSENRRIATLTQQVNGSPSGSGKVIHALTTELEDTRLQLESTRNRLRTAQKQTAFLQRQHDDIKESLGRTRLENDSINQILARKERMASESLERARKAEVQAKELGRSSREWGTRVREVEAQLGQERILKGRAEAQYDALTTSWKITRERLMAEVAELRNVVESRARENAEEATRLVTLKNQMQEAWKERDSEKGALGDVLGTLKLQHSEVEKMIGTSIGGLVERLKTYENETNKQQEEVGYVSGELKRILRLMRSGEH